MSTFDRAADTALRLIKKNGKAATLVRAVDAVDFDPVDQTLTAGTPGSYPVQVVLLPAGSPSSPWQRGSGNAAGTLETKRSATLYIAQKGLEVRPKNGDQITGLVDGTWTIDDAKVYDPAQDGAVLTIAYVTM